MTIKSLLSARNPIAATGYALMAYATTAAVFAQAAAPTLNRAAADEQKSGAAGVITGFLQSTGDILNLASIAVVTIAIIFAGYQIAFNNKRITDVAPVLIGGVLIGGAGQIASMLVGTPAVVGS